MKLVGDYKVNVVSVDKGKNAKGNNLLKLGLEVTDEYRNGEFHEMNPKPVVVWHGSLNTVPGKGGVIPVVRTLETIKEVFGFKGGLSELHNLMFGQARIICEDHAEGNFTRIKWLNKLDQGSSARELKEFSSDDISELEKYFN